MKDVAIPLNPGPCWVTQVFHCGTGQQCLWSLYILLSRELSTIYHLAQWVIVKFKSFVKVGVFLSLTTEIMAECPAVLKPCTLKDLTPMKRLADSTQLNVWVQGLGCLGLGVMGIQPVSRCHNYNKYRPYAFQMWKYSQIKEIWIPLPIFLINLNLPSMKKLLKETEKKYILC